MRDIWATFKSTLPASSVDDPHPPGFPVAQALHEGLLKANPTAEDVENWRDVGYSIDVVVDDRRVFLFLSAIEESDAHWALCCTSDLGWLARQLGRRDDVQRLELARLVDQVLHNDQRFSEIRWYGAGGWRGGKNDDWKPHP